MFLALCLGVCPRVAHVQAGNGFLKVFSKATAGLLVLAILSLLILVQSFLLMMIVV